MQGKIIKILNNEFVVKVDDKNIVCNARGKIRNEKESLLVGDNVIINESTKTIEKVIPRINKLDRPLVANVDKALIMTSVKEPDLSLILLDKLISIITINKIEPIICFSKIDLLNDIELNTLNILRKYYESMGYKVYYNNEIDRIINDLKNNLVVLTGQTGSGKSTFLNKINPNLNLKTNPISESLNRGVHTTRYAEIYNINDVYFIDTPGFSLIDFQNTTLDELKTSFKEFALFSCKYKDCNHDKENECGVKDAVANKQILKERYDNYLVFKNEIEINILRKYKN